MNSSHLDLVRKGRKKEKEKKKEKKEKTMYVYEGLQVLYQWQRNEQTTGKLVSFKYCLGCGVECGGPFFIGRLPPDSQKTQNPTI